MSLSGASVEAKTKLCKLCAKTLTIHKRDIPCVSKKLDRLIDSKIDPLLFSPQCVSSTDQKDHERATEDGVLIYRGEGMPKATNDIQVVILTQENLACLKTYIVRGFNGSTLQVDFSNCK